MRTRVGGSGGVAVAVALVGLAAFAPASAQQGLGLPLFQFYAFYAGDLEITPGPAFAAHGRIHTNGDLYLDGNPGPLTIGDQPATGVHVVQVSAGGRIYRGRKDVNQCSGTVRIDTTDDAVAPFGDLDDRLLPCLGSGTQPVSSEIATWGGVLAEQSPYAAIPGPDVILRDGPYWAVADLRIVLRLNATPPHAIEVWRADGTVDPTQTVALHSFMTDEAWNRGTTPGQGPSTLPGTAPVFYTDVPLGTAGCDCAPGTPTCGSTNASCYAPPFGPPQPAIPPYGVDTTRVYGRNMFDHDPRRGGFYNHRERKWMLLLDVNVADLLRWNAQHGSPFFANAQTDDGGLVLFLTVIGPDSDGVNAYGVRIFGSANLPIPGGIGAADPTGLTIVTDQALYVLGDFNRGPGQTGDLPRQPAALVGDSINMLSGRFWTLECAGPGCRDGQSPLPLSSIWRLAAATTVNAALVGGADPTSPGNSNGSLQNFPRFHENWAGVIQHWRGSFVSLGPPQHVAGPWCGTGSGCNIYNPPSRDWDFESAFLDDVNLPPFTPRLYCGNGLVDDGEACDDGNAAPGFCCSPTCNFVPADTSCGSDGNPCTRDACDGNGACAHAPGNAGTVCRGAADVCDAAEQCDGIGPDCPADVVFPSDAVCRPAAGACDLAEHCDGAGTSCPPDAKRTDVCRGSSDGCDPAEFCDGMGNDCPPPA